MEREGRKESKNKIFSMVYVFCVMVAVLFVDFSFLTSAALMTVAIVLGKIGTRCYMRDVLERKTR